MIGVAFTAALALAAAPDTIPAVLAVPDEVLALLSAVQETEGLGEEEMADLLEEPIDLSSASRTRLAAIPFITAEEVQALLALRERLGGHLALADLAALGRMGDQLAKRLVPFVRTSVSAAGKWVASLAHSARSGSSGRRATSEAHFGWESRGGSQASFRVVRGGTGTRALASGAVTLSGSIGRTTGRVSFGGFRLQSLLGVISDGGMRTGAAGREWIPGGGVSEVTPVSRRLAPLVGAAATLDHGGDALRCGFLAFASPARHVVTDVDAGLYTVAPARWGGSVWMHAQQFDLSVVAVRAGRADGSDGRPVWRGGVELCLFRPGWTGAFEAAGGVGEGTALAAGLQCGTRGWECSLRFRHAAEGFVPPFSAPWSADPVRPQESRIEASGCGSPVPWAEVRCGFLAVKKPSYARALPLTMERDETWLTLVADLTRSASLTAGVASSRTESGESSPTVPGAPLPAVRLVRGTVGLSFRPGSALELHSRVGFVQGDFPAREGGMVWILEARLDRPSITASLRFGAFDVDAYDARVSVYDPASGFAGANVFLYTSGWCVQGNIRWSPFRALHLILAFARYGPPAGRPGVETQGIRWALQGTL